MSVTLNVIDLHPVSMFSQVKSQWKALKANPNWNKIYQPWQSSVQIKVEPNGSTHSTEHNSSFTTDFRSAGKISFKIHSIKKGEKRFLALLTWWTTSWWRKKVVSVSESGAWWEIRFLFVIFSLWVQSCDKFYVYWEKFSSQLTNARWKAAWLDWTEEENQHKNPFL